MKDDVITSAALISNKVISLRICHAMAMHWTNIIPRLSYGHSVILESLADSYKYIVSVLTFSALITTEL